MAEEQYRDNVTVDGETFNGTKFRHKLYFQGKASKADVLNQIRAREPSAQKASLKIYQGPTLEALRAKQKRTDAALAKGPTVVHKETRPTTTGAAPAAGSAPSSGTVTDNTATSSTPHRSHWYTRDADRDTK